MGAEWILTVIAFSVWAQIMTGLIIVACIFVLCFGVAIAMGATE